MKRTILFLLASALSVTTVYSQVQMQGKITIANANNTPVEFANIVLYSASDTTQMVAGTITDLNGDYLFENLETGNFRISISCIGFTSISQPIRVTMPSSGDILIRNFTMEEDAKLLAEVTVEGQLRRQYIDKASYTFTAEDIKSARYSKDLLETLPELTIDVYSGEITPVKKGGPLRILINGATATDNEMKMIPPEKVLRVEYYDFPPARYTGAGAVVNIITRTLDDGYGAGIDVSHAVSTGFGNDNLYGNYNKGRNQFSFEYKINYRNYKDRENENLYKYVLNDELQESFYFRKSKFGYTTHTINLKYTSQLVDNYIFQANIKPNFETRFQKGKSDIVNTFKEYKTEYYGNDERETVIFSPVIDVYVWKSLPDESEFSANVVATMFRTSVENNVYEYEKDSGLQTLKDEMQLENRKQSLIGEAVYTRNYGLTSWDSGYQTEISWLNSDIDNLFGTYNYDSHYTEQYLYTELSGVQKKILYRISLGAKHIQSKSYSNKYSQFVFSPLAMLGYQINQRNTIRLVFMRDTELPGIADLSNNAEVITKDIISTGNPLLVNETQMAGAIIYTIDNPYFNVHTGFIYAYNDKPINQYFTKEPENDYFTLTKENAIHSKQYSGMLNGEIKPFGNSLFSIKTSIEITKETIKSDLTGKISNWYTPIYVEGIFKYKKILASYSYRFTSNSLKGAYLVRDENDSHAMVRFNHKNISLSAGMLFTFMPSRYHSETLPQSIVYHTSNSRIWDNKSMVILGVSWNFNKGKDYKTNRTLTNEDNDAGIF